MARGFAIGAQGIVRNDLGSTYGQSTWQCLDRARQTSFDKQQVGGQLSRCPPSKLVT
jgi:hypothetical protein